VKLKSKAADLWPKVKWEGVQGDFEKMGGLLQATVGKVKKRLYNKVCRGVKKIWKVGLFSLRRTLLGVGNYSWGSTPESSGQSG